MPTLRSDPELTIRDVEIEGCAGSTYASVYANNPERPACEIMQRDSGSCTYSHSPLFRAFRDGGAL